MKRSFAMISYPTAAVRSALDACGYCFLEGHFYKFAVGADKHFQELLLEWNRLPPDNYLASVDPTFDQTKNSIYRFRRWGQFRFSAQTMNLEPLPYRPFVQYQVASLVEREVSPWLPRIYHNDLLHELIRQDYISYRPLLPASEQYTANVHLIRVIDGNPSPEGVHQDDVYFFSVRLLQLVNCRGGGADIFSTDHSRVIESIHLTNRLDTYFVDDRRVAHRGNPVTRTDADKPVIRDVLIISFALDIPERQ
jgi:hypothetical protein